MGFGACCWTLGFLVCVLEDPWGSLFAGLRKHVYMVDPCCKEADSMNS
jgi:hypothetical protein